MARPCLLLFITMTYKKIRIKKPNANVKISNLINYLTICCQNGKGAMVLPLCKSHLHENPNAHFKLVPK